MKQIEKLKKRVEDAGLKMPDVLREAKVPIDTYYNWERKEPKSFETLEKIENAIITLSNEIHSENS